MSDPAPASSGSWFDRRLARRAIDAEPYRALVRAYFLMDFRNQQYGKSTSTGPKSLITPLFWVLGQNLIVGLICSVVLFARVDVEFFTLVGLTVSIITVAAAVVVEFNEIVLDPNDLGIVGHRPIPARTYAAARVTNLAAYLFITSFSVGLFPAFVGAGLRDAGPLQLPAYLAAALVGDFLAAGLVILAYLVVMRARPAAEAQELLAWLQVALILILFYGGQLLLRDPQQKIQWLAYAPPAWTGALPSAWLAQGAVELGHGGGRWSWVLAAGGLAAVIVWGVVLSRLSVAYAQVQPGRRAWVPIRSAALQVPGELGTAWMRRATKPGQERAAFWLTWTMFGRDHNLRMRCWPTLAMVVAMLLAGAATGQLKIPGAAPVGQAVLTLGAMYLVGGAVPALLHNLRFSEDFAAGWVLATAPLSDGVAFVNGVKKAVALKFLVPVLVLMAVVFLVIWRDPLAALLHTALAGVAAWGMLSVCAAIQLRRLPFAAPLARGESFGPIAPLAAATTAAGMLLATLHGASAQKSGWLPCFALGLAAATLVIHVATKAHLRRRLSGGFAA